MVAQVYRSDIGRRKHAHTRTHTDARRHTHMHMNFCESISENNIHLWYRHLNRWFSFLSRWFSRVNKLRSFTGRRLLSDYRGLEHNNKEGDYRDRCRLECKSVEFVLEKLKSIRNSFENSLQKHANMCQKYRRAAEVDFPGFACQVKWTITNNTNHPQKKLVSTLEQIVIINRTYNSTNIPHIVQYLDAYRSALSYCVHTTKIYWPHPGRFRTDI